MRSQGTVPEQLALPFGTRRIRPARLAAAVECRAGSVRRPTEDASVRGRIGAFRLHATHDSREITEAARHAFLRRFERVVDPAGVLDPTERQRRAQCARREYFTRLALASAHSRRKQSS